MILWRSDLAHSNAPPQWERRHRKRFRAVSYVCMLPADQTKEGAYRRKAEGHANRKTTSHWPNLEFWFRERPRERLRFAHNVPPQAPKLATKRQRELHGLERYAAEPPPPPPLPVV
jgi:hypothetical protein